MARYEHAGLRVSAAGEYENGENVVVYSFERNWIKIIIGERILQGNYWIGTLEDGVFTPCYVGRATEQPLVTRILQHTKSDDDHYYDESHYFHFDAAYNEAGAIWQECMDYHSFGAEDELDNKVHPALPEGVHCPWPGCEHVGGE